MAFGLTMGTERATALQNAIQDELLKRQYSSEPDPVMAEYITIMVINNKTPSQIVSELEDLIGSDFDASFVDWLFAEAAKGAPETEAPPAPEPSTSAQPPVRDPPPHQALEIRRPPNAPRAGAPLYSQALSQAIPSVSPSSQKRTASARSPSPGGLPPMKSRRMDLPTGPRAMLRDRERGGNRERDGHGPGGGPRSLMDRLGPARGGLDAQFGPHDDVQARIDSITNGQPDPNMMMMNGFPMNGMGGMDVAAMGMNPMMLQDFMLSQMAMMSQIAGAMGIMNQANGQMMNGGFPMPPGMGDTNGFNGVGNGGNGMGPGGDGSMRGRGRGRGGASRGGRGRGGHIGFPSSESPVADAAPAPAPQPAVPTAAAKPPPIVVAAPTPLTPSSSTGSVRPSFVAPERPQSPTLCKYALKCTNPICRYSHPSPVATPESGVVLSNDACEKGKNCKDKDCIKAHVSPAVLNPNAEVPKSTPFVPQQPPQPQPQQNGVPCRYGAACTRAGCSFAHPPRPGVGSIPVPCKFGSACTRATCQYQHPEGRVLPSTFHRGLSASGPLISVPTPETGTMTGPSPHRSVTFKRPDGTATSAAELEKQVREMEERKSQAQKAIAQAQAGKKDDASATVPISA